MEEHHVYQFINPEPLLEAMSGDSGACRHMFNTFVQSAPAIFARLQESIQTDSFARIKQESHSLKGMTALVGASVLTELLKSIERQSRDAAPQSVQPQLPELDKQFTAVLSEVKHYVEYQSVAH